MLDRFIIMQRYFLLFSATGEGFLNCFFNYIEFYGDRKSNDSDYYRLLLDLVDYAFGFPWTVKFEV